MLWKNLRVVVNHCCRSERPCHSLPVKCKREIFLRLLNVYAVSKHNCLHLENGTSVCGNNLTAPGREGGEINCSLFIGYFPVDKTNESDQRASTWVALSSTVVCNRR